MPLPYQTLFFFSHCRLYRRGLSHEKSWFSLRDKRIQSVKARLRNEASDEREVLEGLEQSTPAAPYSNIIGLIKGAQPSSPWTGPGGYPTTWSSVGSGLTIPINQVAKQ